MATGLSNFPLYCFLSSSAFLTISVSFQIHSSICKCTRDRELPQKTLAAMRHALTLPGWQWLFDVDDDTVVDAARLAGFVQGLDAAAPQLFGHPGRCSPFRCLGGAGMLYSRPAAELVARAAGVPQVARKTAT